MSFTARLLRLGDTLCEHRLQVVERVVMHPVENPDWMRGKQSEQGFTQLAWVCIGMTAKQDHTYIIAQEEKWAF